MIGNTRLDDELGRYALKRSGGLPPAFAEPPAAIGAPPQDGPPGDLPGRAAELQNQFGPGADGLPPAPPPAMPYQQPAGPAQQTDQPGLDAIGPYAQQKSSPQSFFDGSQPQPTPQTDNPDKGLQIADAILSGLSGRGYDAGFWQQKQAARQAAAEKNPGSQQSAVARSSASPLLRQLGLNEDEIAHMSAADIAGISKGGQLMEAIAKARQQAAHERAVQADKLEAEKRHNAEWDRENQITAPQRLEASQQQGATALQNQKEMAGVQHELGLQSQTHGAELSLANSKEMEAEREAARIATEGRKEKAHTKQAQDLVENYRKANPYLDFADPELLASAYQTRGKVKLTNDLQDAAVLHGASGDLSKIRDQFIAATEAKDVSKAYALSEKYHLAANKAADALVRLGGNASDSAKKAALAKFPSIWNPFGPETLTELQDELNNVIDDKIGSAYGGTVKRPGKGGELGTTPTNGPKVNKAIKGMHVRAPDGKLSILDSDLTTDELSEMRDAGYEVVE